MAGVYLYVYVMTNDTGFAPCVEDGKLSLVCCKGGVNGMRQSVYKHFYDIATGDKVEDQEIWILGLCGKGLAKHAASFAGSKDFDEYQKLLAKIEYAPVYLAKVEDVLPMVEYFAEGGAYSGRRDAKAYRVEDGTLVASPSIIDNPHIPYDAFVKSDIAGGYAVVCDEFYYWGKADNAKRPSFDELVEACERTTEGVLEPERDDNEGEGNGGIKAHPRGFTYCVGFEGIDLLHKACKSGAEFKGDNHSSGNNLGGANCSNCHDECEDSVRIDKRSLWS